jgi:tellurium resistance protein TerD
MAVNLEKGQKVKLEKTPGDALKQVLIGLGWDPKDGAASGQDFDLDASLYMLNKGGKVNNSKGLIFYGHLKSSCGSILHTGDNLTGEGEGDDEQIKVDLTKVPADIEKLVVVVNIYQAESKSQNFGMVENSFMRIVDENTNEEKFHFDLNFDASTATGVIFGTLLRKGEGWAFSADQTEFNGGLQALNERYGV